MISGTSEDCTFSFNLSTPDYQGYDKAHNFLANVGYTKDGRDSITIKFHDAGIYSFDSIDVIMQPMDNYRENVLERNKNVLENTEIVHNGFKGTVNLSESQLMFFSVPYSKGFEAFVDGEKAEILRANTWGMALDLDEGEHTIEFRYETQGLKVGAVLSIAGFIAFAGVITYYNIKKRKEKVTK
ncbi:MAG: YfhO family protein [Ruminococcus sp.]|nr:YfhO family protein [Ruminococcus sp.]